MDKLQSRVNKIVGEAQEELAEVFNWLNGRQPATANQVALRLGIVQAKLATIEAVLAASVPNPQPSNKE